MINNPVGNELKSLIFGLQTLKFKLRHIDVIPPNDANGMANSEDPDQTAP